jgi:signal transduction histidine kinase
MAQTQSSTTTTINDTTTTQTIHASELSAELRQVTLFADSKLQDFSCLGEVELVRAPAGAVLYDQGDRGRSFWILLEGQVRALKIEKDGSTTLLGTLSGGETFGEVQILAGFSAGGVSCHVDRASTLVQLSEEGFWRLMSNCSVIRGGVLRNMAHRLQNYQMLTLHREKLISLGTLAAGLMHELNNPGAAARRASSQLRENMKRLQDNSLCFITDTLTGDQAQCMRSLQEHAMTTAPHASIGSLEQSDREEALAEWLEQEGIEGAWKLAPALISVGLTKEELQCAQTAFGPQGLADAVNWLEALSSSMSLVGTIEESISRVSELVAAVKKYAYEDKPEMHKVDVHDSILSTLTILGHKFREKEIRIEKDLAPDLPTLVTCGTGLSQVWTNLLDNAIDASPQKGRIRIRTWKEEGRIGVAIADEGTGISEGNRQHIFEPFFTTKDVGVGTGLGLDIVHRIVESKYHGEVTFASRPGNTEFIVRLPLEA